MFTYKRLYFIFVVIMFLIVMAVSATAGEPQKDPSIIVLAEAKEETLEERLKALEKKVSELEKKAEKAEKKSLRFSIYGEARYRIMTETWKTPQGFYGTVSPETHPGIIAEEKEYPRGGGRLRDETAFPVRIRLNMDAEVVPETVHFWGRLTINKRFGKWEASLIDPFDNPNAYLSAHGGDFTPRFEQAYLTFKLPFGTTWYAGRLPGLDGPPARVARSLFPRVFIDSEIVGTLLKWDAPREPLGEVKLPWAERLWGEMKPGVPALDFYERKVREKTGFIAGYLKYKEMDFKPDDPEVALAQGTLKIGKDTSVILSGLFMDDWHMPRASFRGKETYTDKKGNEITIPFFTTNYYLTGLYLDTQIFGFQVYVAHYRNYFKIPTHQWKLKPEGGPEVTFEFPEKDFAGHIWWAGMNTGDLIGANHHFCIEYAKGSDEWINPFNMRGYRRKGTVLYPANNYYYNPWGVDKVIVGFYPFNAGVLDVYYDYFFTKKVRLRVGLMNFVYSKHKPIIEDKISVFGSSEYRRSSFPYFEIYTWF